VYIHVFERARCQQTAARRVDEQPKVLSATATGQAAEGAGPAPALTDKDAISSSIAWREAMAAHRCSIRGRQERSSDQT
jgi:hypothetical protein